MGELVRFVTATLEPHASHRPPENDEGAGPIYVRDSSVVDGSWHGTIRVRDVRDLVPRVVWSDPNAMVTRIVRCGGGCAALVKARHTHPNFEAGADQVLLGDVIGEPTLRSLGRTWRFLSNIAVSPAADRLAVLSGAPPRELEILETSTCTTLASAGVEVGGTGGRLAWSPDANTLVVAERGGFSFRSAVDLRELAWFASPYAAHVSFSPDGTLICLGDWRQGTVLPWPELIAEYGAQRPLQDQDRHVTTARESNP